MAAPPSPTPMLLSGLSLEQYAGITAALAEGFPLDTILEQEGIAREAWEEAARAWTKAVVAEMDLQLLLVQKRRIAEDCLGRAISPLDSDKSAWAGLLGALATSEEPSSVAEALGLTMSDIARLGRAWKRRIQAEPSVAKELAELAATAKAPTRIEAEPRKLRPFPWTSPRRMASTSGPIIKHDDSPGEAASAGHPQRQLASFQLRAQEDDGAGQRPNVSPKVSPAAAQPPKRRYVPLVTADLPPTEELRRLIAAAEPRAAMGRSKPAPVEPDSSDDGSANAGGTAELTRPPDVVAALPFRESAMPASDTPPSLSLHDYARFRAQVRIRGENDETVWRLFGIGSLSAKEKLQGMFAARFRADPKAQADFIALVEKFAALLSTDE